MSHYTIQRLDDGQGKLADPDAGLANLKSLFPIGAADEMNFVLFSTSGVHGSYVTIEDIEAQLGGAVDPGEDAAASLLTVLVVMPRIVCLRYGTIRVSPDDIPWLKKLRASSKAAIATIGEHDR